VRIEGHDDGSGAAFAGDAAYAIEDLAVASVHTIEIAEGQDRLGPARGPLIVGKMDNVHGTAITAEIAEDSHVHHEVTKTANNTSSPATRRGRRRRIENTADDNLSSLSGLCVPRP
jgi:hypothetical protein